MYFLLAYANTIAITKDVNVNRPTMDHNAARRDLREEEAAMVIISQLLASLVSCGCSSLKGYSLPPHPWQTLCYLSCEYLALPMEGEIA